MFTRRRSSYLHALPLWSAIALCSTLPALAQAPTGLTVKTATSKQVVLSWTGTAASYSVQRAPLGGAFATVGSPTTATFTDTTIDPYTTYQYQVVAGSSAASNQVTVGPPPSGLSNVAPAPLIGTTPSDAYGYDLSLTLDGNGDPAFIFVWQDPTNTGDDTKTQLLFRNWNRATYQWNPIVKVDVVGDIATTFHATSSLAYDSSTSTYAIATEDGANAIDVYVSADNGVTWTKKTTYTGSNSYEGPSLRLAGGKIYLSWFGDFVGEKYVTGTLSAAPATWTTKTAPDVAGTELRGGFGPSLALDSAGNPGIAYWVSDSTKSYTDVLVYWRPDTSAPPVRVTDTQGNQSDNISVKLAYSNLNPRILFYAQRSDADFGVDLHYVQSNDGGLSWQTPVVIPPDGNSSTDYPADLTVGSQGQIAVGFGQNAGSGDAVCGSPKISRSTDGVHFTTCAIAPVSVTGGFGSYPGALQLAFGGNDKLYLLWWEQGDSQANSGILMFREPPANAITGPVIQSVVDGASFRPNIVAGSWVTITGSNLSDVTRTWGDNDFHGDGLLPTSLSGVSVKMNGLPAAVYYVSSNQLNVQAPNPLSGTVSVQVTHNGVASNTVNATVVNTAPALFSYTVGNKQYPAAVYANTFTVVGDPAVAGNAVAKAHPGDHVALYGTGLAPSSAGNIVNAVVVVPSTVTAKVGTADATVEFAGLVASGEFQINIVVPNLPAGEYPVTITVGGQTSQTGVVVPIG